VTSPAETANRNSTSSTVCPNVLIPITWPAAVQGGPAAAALGNEGICLNQDGLRMERSGDVSGRAKLAYDSGGHRLVEAFRCSDREHALAEPWLQWCERKWFTLPVVCQDNDGEIPPWIARDETDDLDVLAR